MNLTEQPGFRRLDIRYVPAGCIYRRLGEKGVTRYGWVYAEVGEDPTGNTIGPPVDITRVFVEEWYVETEVLKPHWVTILGSQSYLESIEDEVVRRSSEA